MYTDGDRHQRKNFKDILKKGRRRKKKYFL